jgi:ribosomal protein L40E
VGAGVLVVVIALGALYGLPLAVLGLATAALVLVVALLWGSVSSLAGETELSLDEALSYGAPSAEEEQKLAVLRALKDLDFERSVGKISEDDYREFSQRYRAEARRLIARVDESLADAQKLAEQLASERIREAGIERETRTEDSESSATDSTDSTDSTADSSELVCSACQTKNDPDARFCKQCGKTLNALEAKISAGEEKTA